MRSIHLLVLALLAASVGCSRGQPAADPAVGQRVADAFLEQIRGGQVEAAWQSTTAEFKSDEGRESFARDVRSKPFLRQPLAFVGYEVTELNGLRRGQCRYEAPAAKSPGSKSPAKIRIVVAQEGQAWRVDGVFFE